MKLGPLYFCLFHSRVLFGISGESERHKGRTLKSVSCFSQNVLTACRAAGSEKCSSLTLPTYCISLLELGNIVEDGMIDAYNDDENI